MFIRILKNKIGLILKITVSLVMISAILLSLFQIRQNDKKLETLANEPIEEYSMDFVQKDLGEEGFKVIASNDKLSLLANIPTGEIALKNISDGNIWYSNPQDRKEDKLAVMATRSSSQIVVKFIDMESGNELTVDSYMGSVVRRGLDYELTENGIKYIYRYPNHGVIIPVEYTLLDDCFEAKVLIDEIEEQNAEAYKIIDISVLPFFAAGGINDNGYMFIPDGSGALINYNNGKTNSSEYSETIYGSDELIRDAKSHELTQDIRMPVFGNKTNNQGFLGIVTTGEASGLINATISGVVTGYNQVYPSIKYREIFITEIDRHGSKRQLKQYGQSNLKGTNFVVRYYPLTDNDANYSGMASCYREYLKRNGYLNKKKNVQSSLALEIYGAIRTTKNVLGIQKEEVTSLSDYSQLYDLCNSLVEDGVGQCEILYRGWNKGGLKSPTNTKASPEKILGGKKEFLSLLDFANENDVNFYFDNDFSNLYKNGNGLSHVSDSAKLLTQDSAKIFDFKYASVDINENSSRYLIMPYLFNELSNKFSSNAKKMGIKGVAETSFAKTLYSDFSKKEQSLRYETQMKIVESLKTIKNNVGNLAVTNGNIYAVSSADIIFDSPTQSSDFDIVDETVPFYSMVLHGYVTLTTESINVSENSKYSMLKAIETGCLPKYTFIHGNTSVLIGTQYSDLFNVRISDWYDQVVTEYKENKNFYDKISGSEIILHKKVQENVYYTEYENGISVTVNYNDKPVVVGDTEIQSFGYLCN